MLDSSTVGGPPLSALLAGNRHMNPWDRIKKELEIKLSPESYQNWISRIEYIGMDGVTLLVSVPDETTKQWIAAEYAAEVLQVSKRLGLQIEKVEYLLPSSREPVEMDARRSQFPQPEIHLRQFRGGRLQSVRACRGAVGGHQSIAQLQSAVHLRRRGHGQDASDARHRPRADRTVMRPCASSTLPASAS